MTRPLGRSLFVDKLYEIDATETRRRLALVMAACRAASIQAGGDRKLDGTLRRVEGELLFAARMAVHELAEALAEHEAKRAPPPPDTPVAEPAPPPAPIRGARLPRLTPRTSP